MQTLRRMPSVLKNARSPARLARVEAEGRERARALLAEAEEAAARLRGAVEAERAQALEAATRAGVEEGRASAAAALLEIAAARERRLSGLEREVAACALEVARKLVGLALEHRPELVTELARRALEPVRTRREVLLRVSPVDAPRLREEQPGLCALLDRAPGIAIREDPAMEPGGVVVETEAGRVDARVEAQLALLERTITEAA